MSEGPIDISNFSFEERLAHYKANEPVAPENWDEATDEVKASYEESHAKWVEKVAGMEEQLKIQAEIAEKAE